MQIGQRFKNRVVLVTGAAHAYASFAIKAAVSPERGHFARFM